MSELPVVSGRETVKALANVAFEIERQRGSHRRIVVPDHKEIAKGTLRAIIRHAGLTVEGFVDLL